MAIAVRFIRTMFFRAMFIRLLFIASGLASALLLTELAFLIILPVPKFFRGGLLPPEYVADRELGFRPVLGNDNYNNYGTEPNEYQPLDKQGRYRILFLGDSVTRRGKINRAIAATLGSANEYWNAGVEAYNTYQEVLYHRHYVRPLQPDLVILFFHLNDFISTPAVSVDEKGNALAYAPTSNPVSFNLFLFKHSTLYRLFLQTKLPVLDQTASGALVQQSLIQIRDDLASQSQGKLLVVVLPIFAVPNTWSDEDQNARARILAILKATGIRHLDVLPALETLPLGTHLSEEHGDTWHPSDSAAAAIAKQLVAQSLSATQDGAIELRCDT